MQPLGEAEEISPCLRKASGTFWVTWGIWHQNPQLQLLRTITNATQKHALSLMRLCLKFQFSVLFFYQSKQWSIFGDQKSKKQILKVFSSSIGWPAFHWLSFSLGLSDVFSWSDWGYVIWAKIHKWYFCTEVKMCPQHNTLWECQCLKRQNKD